jgi:exosortase
MVNNSGSAGQDKSRGAGEVVVKAVARCWPLLLLGALFIVIQWPLLKLWWTIWDEPESYFSHGPLVPFIAGYMVWANKSRLARMDVRSSKIGYVLLVAAGLFFVLGTWTQAATLRALVFILMIFSAMLVLVGPRITRLLAVPICFLFSMIPTAPSLLDSATGKLQLISAAIAAKFITWTGYAATLSGATIYADGLPEPLVVGIPCSGLRTLISLITFTVFFVYLVRAQWWKKAILLAMSFPLSIFINSLRITMIGYAGFWTGSASAMHKFHDYSGYIGLVICFAMLFGLAKLLRAGTFGIPDLPEDPYAPTPKRPALIGGGVPGLAVLVVFCAAGLTNIYGSPIYPHTKGKLVRENIPMNFAGWEGQDLPIEKLVSDWLKQGDLLSRMYVDNSEYGRHIQVFMTASRDPAGFHDPHTCLPGGGSPISEDKIITLDFDKPKPLTVTATLLRSTNNYGESMVLYWYMAGSRSVPRTADVWRMNRANLINDSKRLILNPWEKSKIREEVDSRQFVWYRFSTQVVEDPDTDLGHLKQFARDFVANVKGFGE